MSRFSIEHDYAYDSDDDHQDRQLGHQWSSDGDLFRCSWCGGLSHWPIARFLCKGAVDPNMRCLQAVSPRQRYRRRAAAIRQLNAKGVSISSISVRYGCTENAVKKILSRPSKTKISG